MQVTNIYSIWEMKAVVCTGTMHIVRGPRFFAVVLIGSTPPPPRAALWPLPPTPREKNLGRVRRKPFKGTVA